MKHNEFPFEDSDPNSPKKPRRTKPKAAAVPKVWKAKPKVKSKGPKPKPDLHGGAVKKPGSKVPPAPSANPKYEFQVKEYEAVDPPKVQVAVKVILEPELEPLIAGLKPFERIRLAMKFRRWARQLEVSAKMMLNQSHPNRKPKVPRLNWTRAVWN